MILIKTGVCTQENLGDMTAVGLNIKRFKIENSNTYELMSLIDFLVDKVAEFTDEQSIKIYEILLESKKREKTLLDKITGIKEEK